MRVVLDPNVLVSSLISPNGAPARLVEAWRSGAFELVVSEELLAEIDRALGYSKLRERVTREESARLVAVLRGSAFVAPDPPAPPRRSPDPGDDCLLALAEGAGAVLVSGDAHLLRLAEQFPVRSPRAFLDELER